MSAHANPNIVADGLVLSLDAKDIKSYPGSGTTWYDRSGNGNHATLVNAVDGTYEHTSDGYFTMTPLGYHGAENSSSTASNLSGSYWNIPSDSSLNPSDDSGWSVSGWLNIHGSQTGNGVGWFVMDDGDRYIHLEPISSTFRANGISGWSDLNVNVSNYHNKMTLYTFVYTNSGTYGADNGSVEMYINGVSQAIDVDFIPTNTTDYQINIGRRRGHFQHFLKGDIGNIMFYNRPITADEVMQNYVATKSRFQL